MSMILEDAVVINLRQLFQEIGIPEKLLRWKEEQSTRFFLQNVSQKFSIELMRETKLSMAHGECHR